MSKKPDVRLSSLTTFKEMCVRQKSGLQDITERNRSQEENFLTRTT